MDHRALYLTRDEVASIVVDRAKAAGIETWIPP